jgi:hypothetical protein
MTEAQVATLARRGVVPESNLSWVQAALLMEDTTGSTHGEQAANVSHAPARPSRADAVDVRLEVLETAARDGRGLSPSMAGELATLRRAQAAAARARRREQRLAWAQHSPSAANVPTAPMSRSSPRRTGR